MHEIIPHNPVVYIKLIRELVEVVKIRQQERIAYTHMRSNTEQRIAEISSKLRAFELGIMQNHEEWNKFQDQTFSLIKDLINQSDGREAALILHQRLASRFSGDPLESIFAIYNNNLSSGGVRLNLENQDKL